MRYAEGDRVELFNGDGNNYSASIVSVGKTAQVQIENSEINTTESPVSVTLVQSLAKGTKLDLVVQKATELGVHRITPVSAERSVLQVDEKRANKKAEHWTKIARSACAQCNRSVVPVIDPVIELNKWFTDHAEFAKDTGVILVQCGPRVLRTETAGLAALTIIQSLIGDMC